ncbi:MAG: hypothetical protein V8S39_00215 [Lachnospiraceae bacterium]|nr:MAG TPA: hypothetical protein [Caudoviricetes sp.]
MANEENLKGKGFDSRTTRELREISSRGGKASGKARRKKADFRRTLNLLLTAEIDNPEWTPILKALGLDSTLESALNLAMIKEALTGNVKAYEAIAKYSGQTDKTEKDLEEQKIRTDRAKRARDQETGDNDGAEENIQSFLRAMNPSREDIENLYNREQESEVDEDAEAEETGKV